jgi:hypothetical protein
MMREIETGGGSMDMIKAEIQELHRERLAMLEKVKYNIIHATPEEKHSARYDDIYEEQRQLQESVNELAGILKWIGE